MCQIGKRSGQDTCCKTILISAISEIPHFALKLNLTENSIKSPEQLMTQIQRETNGTPQGQRRTLSSKSNWLLLKVVLEVALGITNSKEKVSSMTAQKDSDITEETLRIKATPDPATDTSKAGFY